MADLLYKVDSGTSKQKIAPRTWTYVKFPTKTSFTVPDKGNYNWEVVLRVEYPKAGTGDILRGRFARYPGTSKIDETGHDDKNTYHWDGGVYHSKWDHTFVSDSTMPVGFWVWHNGSKPIILDGRQIKASKVN